MYHRGSSPVFDAPEFPPLRRLKPLPKRRRTSDVVAQVSDPDDLIPPMADLLGGAESLAEELIAHADSLSSQMALQSYYSSIFGGGHGTRGVGNEAQTENAAGSVAQSFDLGAVYQRFAEGGLGLGRQDEDHSEGDYTDHLLQPGNTKKRKVPANMSGSVNGREAGLPLSMEEEMAGTLSTGRADQDLDILVAPPSSVTQMPRKGKITPSTLAGLQHKELLKHRKRQLAAVLGALSLGDTLALDQALSMHFPFVGTIFGPDYDPPRVRLSRRRGPRLARAASTHALSRTASSKEASLPTAQFTFSCPSATSDRLTATKEEVLALRSRFEAELARQAAKAAKAAAEAKHAVLAASKGSRSKRSDKSQLLPGVAASPDQTAESLDLPPSGNTRGNRKKKRNALAVASNPHHRKNYVPSRLPSSGQANAVQATQNAHNSLGPQPLRFLSAEIPARRRKKATATPSAQIVNPTDEWICPRCEYSLFYGDEPEYRRTVRSRKQILRRRRRAQERAAGGLNAPKNPAKPMSDEEDYDNDYDQSSTQSPVISKLSKWKVGPDIRGMKGQNHLPSG
ncbi:hypothetical protein HYDPIDRAFT_131567 [Hydnomerulius pinastri MD-312]|uniref:Uncharacterized protein n=1 Tax=Hydnomerulius pinastri MD-312 TaxID=994086 RepID=A0A0C9WGC7_9AGAM|nr:hypothetical protein HYDPIDRAFT_131567 [Hydnomerulius pinastri MD-312]